MRPLKLSPENARLLADIDEFKGAWRVASFISPERLRQLRRIASIESVGSSTRIEGVQLTDKEIETLLSGMRSEKFRSRDEEEVAGYADCMETVFESYAEIPIDENHIQQLHGMLLRFSSKDTRHRGHYKTLPNHVEAFDADGSRLGVIFETASPFDTPSKMQALLAWVRNEWDTSPQHRLVNIATFIVHFLAIHPFQDGNGRLSRILTTLMLLKAGYSYVPYSSLERIIEENKDAYYLALHRSQKHLLAGRGNLSPWVSFFLRCLRKQTALIETKIAEERPLLKLPPLSQEIIRLASERSHLTLRETLTATQANRNTLKLHFRNLVAQQLLIAEGTGKGTWYRLAPQRK